MVARAQPTIGASCATVLPTLGTQEDEEERRRRRRCAHLCIIGLESATLIRYRLS
jgi:hypothetical protein